MRSADGPERGRAQGCGAPRRPARVEGKPRVAHRRSVTMQKREGAVPFCSCRKEPKTRLSGGISISPRLRTTPLKRPNIKGAAAPLIGSIPRGAKPGGVSVETFPRKRADVDIGPLRTKRSRAATRTQSGITRAAPIVHCKLFILHSIVVR